MVATGENARETAMSKTVGLPLAIAIRLFSEGKIESRGVQVPISKEFYAPILDELDSLGFQFIEEEVILD